ncbi:MAG: hypothetical protein QOD75_929 [Blastocatellia bacterium]|nr:hypothetical protein [Blastocatellia bacterium]
MNNTDIVRSEIVAFLKRELVGPDPRPEHKDLNDGEEILRPQDPPRLRYSAAVLFPAAASVADADNAKPEEVEPAESGPAEGDEPEDVTPAGAGGDTDQTTEHEVNLANEFLPSALGVTALVRLPTKLKITVRAGRYEKKELQGLGRPDKEGRWQPHYWRKQIEDTILVDCAQFLAESSKVGLPKLWVTTGDPRLKLEVHVFSRPYKHAADKVRDRILTFTLINRTPLDAVGGKDTQCFFQCELMVEDAEGATCFLEYPEREGLEDDREEQSLRLLYNHRKTFAVGHGCAVWWPESGGGAVDQIKSDSLPAYEIEPILPREIPGLELSMRRLAEGDQVQTLQACRMLADAYTAWIEKQEAAIGEPSFPRELKSASRRHLELCRDCHRRIMDGIGLLEADADVRQAFAWMNRAMLKQQLHYDLAANHRREWTRAGKFVPTSTVEEAISNQQAGHERFNQEKGYDKLGRWRPFQLAFILMNLRSIAQPRSAERNIVDLIWFPTGGGKTEAYLGLTAFTILWRRLQEPEDSGTTVLMRYTLRLLTTQQFQRASSLICACELIRKENKNRLGGERISIGLWVGNTVTPNKQPDAVAAHTKLLNEGKPNPFVVLTCPWCGVETGAVKVGNAYRTPGYKRQGTKVVFCCEDPHCEFNEAGGGLPLHVIDEAIYAQRPTLLIGTVDKFAMLPWRSDARRLFGLESDEQLSPPDLIIQDELHLISGALGSMVGHYEGTLDALCQQGGEKKFGAKIVASTATICRAPEQVKALYARAVFLFPPQGLRAGDSFFAEEAKNTPGRLYVGVFGSALSSHVTAQIRVMSALLQAVRCVPIASSQDLDPYWTLMAYFNSLRELGHAATLIRADIREYLNAVWDRLDIRKPEAGSDAPDLRRFINRDLELTSRIQSSEITEVLQSLFANYNEGRDTSGKLLNRAVDVCLATNMIQVGLDVPRLGLMTVVGQPKMTSEYIQATSRVGRDARGPGLVVTIYNTSKPRDRSHFEHFRSYHQSIYRWVEPTSVTPFAVAVRERALHAQVVSLVRYWDSRLTDGPKPPPGDALVERIRKTILARVSAVDAGEAILTEEMFDEIIERWRRLQPALYGQFGPRPDETPLMYPSGTQPRALWASRSKATPSSMRNVDAGCDAAVLSDFPKP